MNKSLEVNQAMFLHVKQRLDYYYLPADFPIEATGLISKLIKIIDETCYQRKVEGKNRSLEEGKLKSMDINENGTSSFSSLINQALRMQMSKYVKENNQLHQTVMTLKQQISQLKHSLSKQKMNELYNKQLEYQTSYNFMNNREKQLVEQLEQIKFKYNELMDMIHGEGENVQKEYIKRLIKHKQFGYGNKQSNREGRLYASEIENISQIKNNRPSQANKSRNKYASEKAWEIESLRQKLQNRQKEIIRLKSKLQFDGINMNKVLKDFQKHKQKQNLANQGEKVKYLEKQLKEARLQNTKMKKQGGNKQALREQVQKLKIQNDQLKDRLNDIKRKNKEIIFDEKKQVAKNNRKLNQTTNKLHSILEQKVNEQFKNTELKEKIRMLENKNSQIQQGRQNLRKQNTNLSSTIQNLNKELQHLKLMKEYQGQKALQRQTQLLQNLSQTQRERDQHHLRQLNIIKENTLMKQQIEKLGMIQQELLKKNSMLLDSTGWVERSVIEAQTSEIYKQHIKELKSKIEIQEDEIVKRQREIKNLTLIADNYRKQTDLLLEENKILNKVVLQSSLNNQTLNQIKKQKQILRQSYEIQKDKNLQLQAQNQQLEFTLSRNRSQLQVLKDQFYKLQSKEKQSKRKFEIQIVELTQGLNIKTTKIQQKELRIKNLECQLIDCTERLRESNKELTKLDDQLHNLKMDKNRLDRKFNEMSTQYAILKQKERTNLGNRQIQLKGELQRLNRQVQGNRILQQQLQIKVTQLIQIKTILQSKIESLQKSNQDYSLQLKNYKQRQQLYQMQIRELKNLTNYSNI